jgi:phospholipase/carboxylesterase
VLEQTLGGLTVRLAGGTDRQGGGDGPMVVLLHGFGAPGTDLVGLWRELRVPSETRFAFPEAPHAVDLGIPGYSGRAWWDFDVEQLQQALERGQLRALSEHLPDGLMEANQRLTGMLDELEARHRVPVGKLILGGFSQGAMLSLDVALNSQRSLAGLVLMSGMFIARERWEPLMPERKGLRVLMSHGRADPLLPFELADELKGALEQAGLRVEFLAFNGAHTISGGVLDSLSKFISSAFEP